MWADTFGSGCAKSYMTCPGSGTACLDRSCLKPPRSARLTSASACSSWPSARAADSESCGNHPGATDSLTGAVAGWPTPQATDDRATSGGRGPETNPSLRTAAGIWQTPSNPKNTSRKQAGGETREALLPRQSEQWPTPNVPTRGAESRESKESRGSGGVDLQTAAQGFQQASAWPTPAARDHKGANSESHMDRSTGSKHLDQLPNFVQHLWQTPQTPGGGAKSRGQDRMDEPLLAGQAETLAQACSRPDHPTPAGPTSSDPPRRLNPQFVAWLMGWPPLAETGCGFSATEWFLYKQQLRSAFCGIVQGGMLDAA